MSEVREMPAGRPRAPRSPARAEVVGSLLRPARLRAALAEIYRAEHSMAYEEERAKDRSRLDEIADEEIRRVVARQVEIGLDVVTDGEFRRVLYTNSLQDAIEGLRPGPKGRLFTTAGGEQIETAPVPLAHARLRKVGSPLAREAAFLAGLTRSPFKVTLPAASWFLSPDNWVPGITDRFYGSHDELTEDVLAIQRDLIAEAIDAGARYVQLDFPRYVNLLSERHRDVLRAAATDPDAFLERALEIDRRIVEGFPADVTFGLHLCRGNFRSSWMYEGSLEPVAERLFNELPYDVFLVEWEDTSREGDYSPLRHVPRGPVVVLGAVSSKVPRLEDDEEVVRALEEASRFLDLEQLAISTQCGFASTVYGNELSEDDQWRKLELVVRIADRIWG